MQVDSVNASCFSCQDLRSYTGYFPNGHPDLTPSPPRVSGLFLPLCLPRKFFLFFGTWVRKIPWRRDRLPTPVFLGFPGGSDGKEFCNVGDLGSTPGLGRSPGGEHGNPLQYSCLENPYGQRSLVGYSPWGRKESDTTERLSAAEHLGLQHL